MLDLRNLFSSILKSIDNFEDKINKLSNKFHDLNKYCSGEINDFLDEMYSLDTRLIRMEQYSRHESLVISGIPDNVPQSELEPTLIKYLNIIIYTY